MKSSAEPESPRAAASAPGLGAASNGAATTATPSPAAPNPAAPSPAPPSPAPPSGPTLPVIPHEYRRVFEGVHALFLQGADPYLMTSDGTVNLKTGVVDFERFADSWVGYRGDSLWFADGFSPMSACPRASTLVQLVKGKWLPRLAINVHSIAVSPWYKGSSLAAIVPRRLGPPWGYELTVLERNRIAPRAARRSANHLPECATQVASLQALLAFPTGEIFVFGVECGRVEQSEADLEQEIELASGDGETEVEGEVVQEPEVEPEPPTIMESWRNGRHEVTAVPFRELGLIVGVGPKDIWATAPTPDGAWAPIHFDGTAWQMLPERYATSIEDLAIHPDSTGVLARRVVVTKERVTEFVEGRAYEHALPPNCMPEDVQLDGEQLWVQCFNDYEPLLYTTRQDIAEVRFQTDGERQLTSFNDKRLPPLDATAGRSGSCGRSREFETLPGPRSGKPGSKLQGLDFGY